MLLRPDLVEGIVNRLQDIGYPTQRSVTEDDLESRVTFEDPRYNEVGQNRYAARWAHYILECLGQWRRVAFICGKFEPRRRSGVKTDRYIQFLARLPQRIVLRVVNVRSASVYMRRHGRQYDALVSLGDRSFHFGHCGLDRTDWPDTLRVAAVTRGRPFFQ